MNAHSYAIVIACAHRRVEDDRHMVDIDAKPRRLARGRDEIEYWHYLDSEIERDRIIDCYRRDPHGCVLRTRIEISFFLRAELTCGALLDSVRISDHVGVTNQTRRQLEVQFLLERRRRWQEPLLRVVFELLGKVERRSQLKRVRTGFFIAFKLFVFRGEFV